MLPLSIITIQETILKQLHKGKNEELIASQLNEAIQILSHDNLKIINYELTTLSIYDIRPSQTDEDYDNNSSKQDAKIYLEVMNKKRSIENVRLDSFRPIVVDKKTMNIIDGNHRHYATKAIGEKFIYVILCEIGKL